MRIRRSTVPTAILAAGLVLGAVACEGEGGAEGEAELEEGGGEGGLLEGEGEVEGD